MIYLDNAATSFPKPHEVTDAVMSAVTHNYGTPGRGVHNHALKSTGAVEAARKGIARFFHMLQEFRVVFTYSATDALNMAVKGFLNDGDRVLISALEHNSVSRPVKGLASKGRITLDVINCDEQGYIDLDDLKSKLPARLVIISHASNVTGTLQPVEEIGRIVRESGSYLLLDAAQTAGRVPVDMQRANVDMLAAAGHKGLYGLQGTGLLIIGERVNSLRPFREGGTGFDSQSELQPVNWPEAFESGTHNVPGILSMAAGLQFIQDTGIEKIAAKEAALTARLYEGLTKHPNIRVYGPGVGSDEPRVAVLSFNIDGWDPADVGDMLNMNSGISVRTGLQCSPMAHRAIGTFPEGTVRVSPGYFNNDEDIDTFLNAVGAIAEIAVPLH